MKTMSAKEAHNSVSQLLDSALQGQPTVLTRNGKPVAVVVPASFLAIGRAFPADAEQSEPI
jgi:prevent-host-death family protein